MICQALKIDFYTIIENGFNANLFKKEPKSIKSN